MDENERAVVTTYLPQRQKRIWQDHADTLDMSQSEFVKTMVQAGRRFFEADESELPGQPITESNPQGSTAGDTGPNEFESTVLEALQDNDHLSWDELLDTVTDDIESELADAITRLQKQNRISHNPREGGYVRVED